MAASATPHEAALQNTISWLKMNITPKMLHTRLQKMLPELELQPDESQPLPPLPTAAPFTPQLLFGLSGRSGVGKTTAAEYMRCHKGYACLAFGDAVKDVIAYLYGLDRDILRGDSEITRHQRSMPISRAPTLNMVQVMQLLATEVFRHFDEDVWIKHLKRKMVYEKLIISDIRFLNELNFVKRHRGFTVLIFRGASPYISSSYHASEQGLAPYHFTTTFNNDGSIEELYQHLKYLEAWLVAATDAPLLVS